MTIETALSEARDYLAYGKPLSGAAVLALVEACDENAKLRDELEKARAVVARLDAEVGAVRYAYEELRAEKP